jgi:hemolysin-activating ACP:hemolysin acyltransferase
MQFYNTLAEPEEEINFRILHDLVLMTTNMGRSVDFYDLSRLKTCLGFGQYTLIKDRSGVNHGFVAWAEVNSESFRQFLNSGKLPRYYYEWKEGYSVILTDLKPFGDVSCMRKHLTSVFFRFRLLAFVHRGRLSVYYRSKGKFKRVQRKNLANTEHVSISCIVP